MNKASSGKGEVHMHLRMRIHRLQGMRGSPSGRASSRVAMRASFP